MFRKAIEVLTPRGDMDLSINEPLTAASTGAIDPRDRPLPPPGSGGLLGPRSRPESRLDRSARKAVARAQGLAASLGHDRTGSIHLLEALTHGRGTVARVLHEHDITADAVRAVIHEKFGAGGAARPSQGGFSDELLALFDAVPAQAGTLGWRGRFGVEALMLALLGEPHSYGLAVIEHLYVSSAQLRDDIVELAKDSTTRVRPRVRVRVPLHPRTATGLAAIMLSIGALSIVPLEVGPIRIGPVAISISTDSSSGDAQPRATAKKR
jgi:Clp amino terminal domain, pathogenicity island component